MKICLLLLPTLASSFVVSPHNVASRATSLYAEQEKEENQENEGLVLDGLDKEMTQFNAKYSFSEGDFLAAARKRAEQKVESANGGASDEEWKKIADEKKEQFGEIDDWENSQKEAGNSDSQILMFTDPPVDGDGDEDGGDSKLLLF